VSLPGSVKNETEDYVYRLRQRNRGARHQPCDDEGILLCLLACLLAKERFVHAIVESKKGHKWYSIATLDGNGSFHCFFAFWAPSSSSSSRRSDGCNSWFGPKNQTLMTALSGALALTQKSSTTLCCICYAFLHTSYHLMIASSALMVTTHVSIEESRNGTSESDYSTRTVHRVTHVLWRRKIER
jgi:hypothetical protein